MHKYFLRNPGRDMLVLFFKVSDQDNILFVQLNILIGQLDILFAAIVDPFFFFYLFIYFLNNLFLLGLLYFIAILWPFVFYIVLWCFTDVVSGI